MICPPKENYSQQNSDVIPRLFKESKTLIAIVVCCNSGTPSVPHSHLTRSKVLCANVVLNAETGKLEECRNLTKVRNSITWKNSCSSYLGRLAQGLRDINGTSCAIFVKYNHTPKDAKIAYARTVFNIRPQKAEK